MTIRYLFLILTLAMISLCFYSASRPEHISLYSSAAMAVAIVALSSTALALALFTLRTMSIVYIARNAGLIIFAVTVFDRPHDIFAFALIATALFLSMFFSETVISRITRRISLSNEDMFILPIPRSVLLWFSLTWSVFWALFAESIHLFGSGNSILGGIVVVIGLILLGLFVAPQMRILYRRSVIVPHGIVLSDLIVLTDVVLFPIAKIEKIFLGEVAVDNYDVFSFVSKKRQAVTLILKEHVDSLIARKGINETERVNANAISFSVTDTKAFVRQFHCRFNKINSKPMSRSEEILAEKELGLDTAPRSDTPLPQHRKQN